MVAAEEVARRHYAERARLATATGRATVGQWERLASTSLLESWLAGIGRIILALVTAGQSQAAASATRYLSNVAAAQGGTPTAPHINPSAFAGISSDGRPLESLLIQPLLTVMRMLAQGAKPAEAMRSGSAALQMIVRTQIADAGRVADGAGVVADKRYVAYVRQVALPACGRCIILAGRTYSWSSGFQRHPMCDCVMVPRFYDAQSGGFDQPAPAGPALLFEQMDAAQQDKAFGKSGAQAIRDGADPGQVINARRGMRSAGGRLVTTSGTGRRRTATRLMPEQIYTDTGGDRDAAIRLLKQHGYIL